MPVLPSSHRALVLRDVNIDPKVESVPVPEVLPGTTVLKVLSAPCLSYLKQIFLGNERGYVFPLPMVPGTSAICRIAALGRDASVLQVGQLVLFDSFIRARDAQDHPNNFLNGLGGANHGTPGFKLMSDGGFRDGAYAEYVRVPLENVFVLDEERLLGNPDQGGLGLGIHDFAEFAKMLVAFGGLTTVDLKPGETVLISPATGPFGGAACMVALAIGAKVLAWGRDEVKLKKVQAVLESINSGRYRDAIEIVKLHNDPAKDAQAIKEATGGRPVDVYFDISPPHASGSSHFNTGIQSLKHGGRVSLMGGLRDDVSLSYRYIMRQDITLKGKWMYEREDIFSLLRMVEMGTLKLGKDGGCTTAGVFGLEDWKNAWDVAEVEAGIGAHVVISP